jgi:DNA-binding transcriptional regulator PaaX
MKRSSVCGKTAIVLYASQQAMSSRLNIDSFNFWNVKNMIKMFNELSISESFVRVALKTSQLSGIAEAII